MEMINGSFKDNLYCLSFLLCYINPIRHWRGASPKMFLTTVLERFG